MRSRRCSATRMVVPWSWTRRASDARTSSAGTGSSFIFQLEISFALFHGVLPYGELQQLGEVGRAVEKQDAFDKSFDVLHFNNGQLLDIAAQFVIVPVLAHIGVEEVLGNGRQLVLQCFIQ